MADTYAMLYNKITTTREYLPGSVLDATAMGFKYSAVHSNATPTYDDAETVTGSWVLLGYLAINTNAVSLYKLEV